MSFDPLIQALKDNPALAEELGNAKTPRERDAILDAHGIEKPAPDSEFPEAGGQDFSSGDLRSSMMDRAQNRRPAGSPPGGSWPAPRG